MRLLEALLWLLWRQWDTCAGDAHPSQRMVRSTEDILGKHLSCDFVSSRFEWVRDGAEGAGSSDGVPLCHPI